MAPTTDETTQRYLVTFVKDGRIVYSNIVRAADTYGVYDSTAVQEARKRFPGCTVELQTIVERNARG